MTSTHTGNPICCAAALANIRYLVENDLIGNAAEYVQDVYHSSYGGAPRDGRPWEQETGPITERRRVVRNGSFADPPARQRASRRSSRKPTEAAKAIGFRCAAD